MEEGERVKLSHPTFASPRPPFLLDRLFSDTDFALSARSSVVLLHFGLSTFFPTVCPSIIHVILTYSRASVSRSSPRHYATSDAARIEAVFPRPESQMSRAKETSAGRVEREGGEKEEL